MRYEPLPASDLFSLLPLKIMPKLEAKGQCEPCGTPRGEKCWGHCVDSRKVWCKCEVCDWQEQFHTVDLNRENCTDGFCEDCDQPRIFVLVG